MDGPSPMQSVLVSDTRSPARRPPLRAATETQPPPHTPPALKGPPKRASRPTQTQTRGQKEGAVSPDRTGPAMR